MVVAGGFLHPVLHSQNLAQPGQISGVVGNQLHRPSQLGLGISQIAIPNEPGSVGQVRFGLGIRGG